MQCTVVCGLDLRVYAMRQRAGQTSRALRTRTVPVPHARGAHRRGETESEHHVDNSKSNGAMCMLGAGDTVES